MKKKIIIIVSAVVLALLIALSATILVLYRGSVSRDEWRRAVNLPDNLSGYSQTAYNEKGELLYSFTVKFDKTTLYRIEKGADGLTDYELYIQYANKEYIQYRNEYSEKGEPGTWKKTTVKSEAWDNYLSFLFGIDDDYGLEEFLYYDDYTYDIKNAVYYADEIPVIYGEVYFTEVTVRFDNKKMVEFNLTQNLNKGNHVVLKQTFEYDGGEFSVPEDIAK